ncbi:MAG TPA: PHP domain-containing protein [Caldilineae bacterium]|nr:PHP domain-containing protein [Caldilineae bacterium]
MTLRFDLHLHSHYSVDCLVPPERIVEAARRAGLDGIALTDHNEIEGALRLAEALKDDDLYVIPGEEIATRDGEIIGLFLKERIPSGLPARETVSRIKAQGGLVYIPHPVARGVPPRIRWPVLLEILPDVDIIEGFNARVPLATDNHRARALALAHGKAIGAGSDAHFAFEYGRAWVEVETFHSPQEFLERLRHGRIFGERRTPYWVSGITWTLKRIRLAWRALNARRINCGPNH